jgi:hypothetical protein
VFISGLKNSLTRGLAPSIPPPFLPQPKPWGRKGAKRDQALGFRLWALGDQPNSPTRFISVHECSSAVGLFFISVHECSSAVGLFFISVHECSSAVGLGFISVHERSSAVGLFFISVHECSSAVGLIFISEY